MERSATLLRPLLTTTAARSLHRSFRLSRAASSYSSAYLPRKVCIAAAQAVISRGEKFAPQDSEVAARNSTQSILRRVVGEALEESGLKLEDLDGVVSVPSLASPHFMEAHHQATQLGLFDHHSASKSVWCRTIDTGGAGPVSAINAASTLIQANKAEVIAVVAVDAVGSLDAGTFSERADQSCQNYARPFPSPVIPHGYSRVTEYQLKKYPGSLTRDHLRLVPVLESIHASQHPDALTQRPYSLEDIQNAREVAPNISLLECARRADGGACIILASNHFLRDRGSFSDKDVHPVILGSGEASGPLFPPDTIERETYFSCEAAMRQAYEDAQLSAEDIDFFGLYDCFPICFIRALEAAGVVPKGEGGEYLEAVYKQYQRTGRLDSSGDLRFPVNTHGGLLCYGAPWEVPAAYNVVEAVQQLKGKARGRRIENCRRALVYGNGGVFSSSAVCIIGRGRYQ